MQAGGPLAVADGADARFAGVQDDELRAVQIGSQDFQSGENAVVGTAEAWCSLAPANANPQRNSGSGMNGT